MTAVTRSQNFEPLYHLAWLGWPAYSTPSSASTIARDDISSTNVDCDVTGMSRIGFMTSPAAQPAAWTAAAVSPTTFETLQPHSCGQGPTFERPLYTR